MVGSALGTEEMTPQERAVMMGVGALGGGALGLGTVKSLMRGLGPSRLAYEGSKALSKEATPSIVMQQFEKSEKPAKNELTELSLNILPFLLTQ